ncbi:hypothetical protein YC2023_048673 [Brassica napus]
MRRDGESLRWVCVGLRRRREIERELRDGFASEIERERARDGFASVCVGEERSRESSEMGLCPRSREGELEMGRQWRRREISRWVVNGGEERAREASSMEEKRELDKRRLWRRRESSTSVYGGEESSRSIVYRGEERARDASMEEKRSGCVN